MELPTERLTWLALCAIYDAARDTLKAPVQTSAGLRLALAWLYAISPSADRAVFVSFWETVRRPAVDGWSPGSRFARAKDAQHLMRLIVNLSGQQAVMERLDARKR